jgi:hypothetical protein
MPKSVDELYLGKDEREAGMLLPSHEQTKFISHVVPEIEGLLQTRSLSGEYKKDLTVNCREEVKDLIRKGMFSSEQFAKSYNWDTTDEKEAVNIWEDVKDLRNASVGLVTGILLDYVRPQNNRVPLISPSNYTSFDYNQVGQEVEEKGEPHEHKKQKLVDNQYLEEVKGIMSGLNVTLKQGLQDVLQTLQQEEKGSPLSSMYSNMEAMVTFANKWHLARKQGKIEDVHEFIARGLESMTVVPYQFVDLIWNLKDKNITRESLLETYRNSFSSLIYFANGDRDVLGQTRRRLEIPGTGRLDPKYFTISPEKNAIALKKDLVEHVENETRRSIVEEMKQDTIWQRGTPTRTITYCPASSARKGRVNDIKVVYDWTGELFQELNERL